MRRSRVRSPSSPPQPRSLGPRMPPRPSELDLPLAELLLEPPHDLEDLLSELLDLPRLDPGGLLEHGDRLRPALRDPQPDVPVHEVRRIDPHRRGGVLPPLLQPPVELDFLVAEPARPLAVRQPRPLLDRAQLPPPRARVAH